MPDGTTLTPARMIEMFVALRAKIHEIKETHKKQLAPYTDAYIRLEGLLLVELDKAEVNSMKTDTGTVFKAVATSVTVKDWTATFGFIKDYEMWDLLDARVSKTAALAVIEERGEPIPGVQVSQAAILHVRKA